MESQPIEQCQGPRIVMLLGTWGAGETWAIVGVQGSSGSALSDGWETTYAGDRLSRVGHALCSLTLTPVLAPCLATDFMKGESLWGA